MTASLGGIGALEEILSRVPREFPAPILIAHHLGDDRSFLAELLELRTVLRVAWATHTEALEPGRVYVGPPGSHITVSKFGRCRLERRPRHNYVRPSGDLLFRSAAERMGPRVIAVVLSGRLRDGAGGTLDVRAAGGLVIAQDPASCAASGMPSAAIAAGGVHFVLPPPVIASALVSLVMVPGAAELFGVGMRPPSHAA